MYNDLNGKFGVGRRYAMHAAENVLIIMPMYDQIMLLYLHNFVYINTYIQTKKN